MATGRKTVVVGQVIDPVVWGNPLWDQSVQGFASAADRTAQFPAPLKGAVTWLDDVARWEGWNGAAWVNLSGLADVAWTQIVAFAVNYSAYLTAPWNGVWVTRRGGTVTIAGAVQKAGAPTGGDVIFTLPAPLLALAPLHPVQGYASGGSGPIARVDGTIVNASNGSTPFSFAITYAQGAA